MLKVLAFLQVLATYFAWQYYEWGKDWFKAAYEWVEEFLPFANGTVAAILFGIALGLVVFGFKTIVGGNKFWHGTLLMCVGFLLCGFVCS